MRTLEFVGGPNDGEVTTFAGPLPCEILVQTVTVEPTEGGYISTGPLPPHARYLLDPEAMVYQFTPAVKEPAWRSPWTSVGLIGGFIIGLIADAPSRPMARAGLIAYIGAYLLLRVPLRWLPEWMR